MVESIPMYMYSLNTPFGLQNRRPQPHSVSNDTRVRTFAVPRPAALLLCERSDRRTTYEPHTTYGLRNRRPRPHSVSNDTRVRTSAVLALLSTTSERSTSHIRPTVCEIAKSTTTASFREQRYTCTDLCSPRPAFDYSRATYDEPHTTYGLRIRLPRPHSVSNDTRVRTFAVLPSPCFLLREKRIDEPCIGNRVYGLLHSVPWVYSVYGANLRHVLLPTASTASLNIRSTDPARSNGTNASLTSAFESILSHSHLEASMTSY